MRRFPRVAALADTRIARLALGLGCFLTALASSLGADWVKINNNENPSIYSRDRPGTSIRELRAVGLVDAPSWVILNVLDEVTDYPDFMPYTTQAQLIERRAHCAIIYFRWDPPLIGARDVTVSVTKSSTKRADGQTTYQLRWEPISTVGPAPSPGVIRITLDEGSWRLEPTEDGKRTNLTYELFTDGGGGLPAFAINMANRQSVNDLFQAIRKQVTLPKYSQKNRSE
ncbi:MAG TPA: SRPBCC family protein [Chthoniobacterales bacterium]|nr:SRPBCC family protein [Chthoniobacterales bacterium]